MLVVEMPAPAHVRRNLDALSSRVWLRVMIRRLRSVARASREEFHSGLTQVAAHRVATLVREAFEVDAVSLVGRAKVLAFVGAGSDHHRPGEPVTTEFTKRVLSTGQPAVARDRGAIGCPDPTCPLTAAIVVPMRVKGMVPAALKLYRTDGHPFRPEAVEGAVLLGELLGAQLELSLLEAEVRRLEREELRALRMEISPHFVFNTLHAVAATCGHDPERARRLVLDFAEFLRHALRAHGEFCTVEEELWYVEHYLNFERMRLGERLRVEVEIPRSLWNLLVPVLTLQPLVENAVVHGVEPKPGPGTVRVRGWEEDGVAVFTVEDDGVGIPEELVEHVTQRGVGSGLGVGLFNVHRRLETIYGPGFGLRVESQEGKGTRVVVRIPRGFPGHRP